MKKKSFRDIRNAVFMLCIMLAMLSTATFAWFSMSDRVTADGMVIKTKTDSASLLILAGEADAATVKASGASAATAENSEATLLPAAHGTVANQAAADTASNWYFHSADSPASSISTSAAKPLSTLDGYVLVNEFSICTTAGSMSNLKCNASVTTTDGGADAVKVLVATSEGTDEFVTKEGAQQGAATLAATVDSNTAISVKVYVYWDGTDDDVFTNNILNLKDTTVALEFVATPAGGASETP